MKSFTRVISALLVLAMALSMLACVANDDGPETTTGNPSTTAPSSQPEQTTEPETTVDPHRDPGLPAKTFDGEVFSMLGITDYSQFYGAQRDLVYIEDAQTNSINEAIRDRNNYVADIYDVTFKGVFIDNKDVDSRLTTSSRAEQLVATMITTSMTRFGSLIDAGYVKELNNGMSAYLDLSADYWNQKCRNNLSIANNIYAMAGDIISSDKEAIWAITFNRDLIVNNQLENPYDMVDAGTWTVDNWAAMAHAVSDYASHDPNDTFNITWGMVSESYNSYYIWSGTGTRLIVKDSATDIPRMGELTENSYNAMLGIATLQFDKTATLFSSYIKNVTDPIFQGTVKIFMDGKSLFNVGSISIAEWMRDRDTDFGVLPMPKATVEQTEYYSSMSGTWTFLIGFQKCLGKTSTGDYDANVLDFASIITQALCCESTDTLLNAYYDKTLCYKGLRREEDERVMGIIFDGRLFDLTLMFDWAGAFIADIGNAKTEKKIKSLKSSYDQYAASINRAVDNFLKKQGLVG